MTMTTPPMMMMTMIFYEDSFWEWMLELAQERIKFQNFQSRPNQWGEGGGGLKMRMRVKICERKWRKGEEFAIKA